MKTIIHIIIKEFLQIRRDRRMLALSILAPIIQLVILGYAATTDIKSIPLLVNDQDRSSISRDFVAQFANSGYFVVQGHVNSSNEIDRHIEEGRVWLALVIPPGFGNGIIAHRSVTIQMIADGSDANSANISLGYAAQIVAKYSRAIALESMAAPAGSEEASAVRIRPLRVNPEVRVWYNPDLKSANFMIPAVVALVLMIVTMTLTSLGVVKEKELGTLEQLMVTPIRPYQLIIGKLLPFVIIGALDVTLVLAAARYWFEVPMRGNVLLLYGLSGLFILTTLGLGLFVSTVSRTQQQAMMTAQFFIFMPFIFFSGFAFPIENMPPLIQAVTYIVPLRYFIVIIRGIFLKGVGIAELWPQALALLIFGVAILTLSVARFRKRLG
jgi:ABC-2 type transport system permease protein